MKSIVILEYVKFPSTRCMIIEIFGMKPGSLNSFHKMTLEPIYYLHHIPFSWRSDMKYPYFDLFRGITQDFLMHAYGHKTHVLHDMNVFRQENTRKIFRTKDIKYIQRTNYK